MPAPSLVRDLFTFVSHQGQIMVESRGFRFEEKPGAGLVTDVDRALEKSLREYLLHLVPDSRVVGEEEGGEPGEWSWWLDPLDGTTNFVHGWPRSAISLALYRGSEAHLALVHDPYLAETFWAQRGEGAWSGATRLQVSRCAQLGQALLATGFAPHPPQQWVVCQQLQARSRGLRVSGCASLDLAYVACGRVDAFWEVDLQPWDVAAGLLLVGEAGGQVYDFEGRPAELSSSNFLACNPALSTPLLDALAGLK
jgi:myo-inositol-1(or 4)-monophosphatase